MASHCVSHVITLQEGCVAEGINRAIGTATREGVKSAIGVLGSSITITPYTIASSDSGYSGQVETNGTAVTEIAIPFEEFENLNKEKFGDLKTGGFQLALKSTAVFDITGSTKYKAIYQGDVYDIKTIKRFAIQDVLVAWIITLSERLA